VAAFHISDGNVGRLPRTNEERTIMHRILREFWTDESGQDLIEYTLILAFVALAAIGVFSSTSGSIDGIWSKAGQKLDDAKNAADAGGSTPPAQ
jgi:Flp pilus assembly pilin Flp